jgi:hypothetical protein
LELRQGAGAFISLNRRTRHVLDHIENARRRAAGLIEELREQGLRDDEISGMPPHYGLSRTQWRREEHHHQDRAEGENEVFKDVTSRLSRL